MYKNLFDELAAVAAKSEELRKEAAAAEEVAQAEKTALETIKDEGRELAEFRQALGKMAAAAVPQALWDAYVRASQDLDARRQVAAKRADEAHAALMQAQKAARPLDEHLAEQEARAKPRPQPVRRGEPQPTPRKEVRPPVAAKPGAELKAPAYQAPGGKFVDARGHALPTDEAKKAAKAARKTENQTTESTAEALAAAQTQCRMALATAKAEVQALYAEWEGECVKGDGPQAAILVDRISQAEAAVLACERQAALLSL
jgi:hypothetical protein